MKRSLLIILFVFLFLAIKAQPRQKEEKALQFGFKIGSVYTQITDLSNVLVSESYYSKYTFTNKPIWGAAASIFINYRFEESISGIQAELSYTRLGNQLHYADSCNLPTLKSLKYDVITKYEYLNFELFYKAYVYKGLSLGVGPRLGFNLTPGALYYTSNGEDQFGPDIRIQQQMRDVLKGRTNFSIGVGVGYEFFFGMSIDARYYYGISDVVETEVNNFHFIENKNASRLLQFTIGYALPYDMQMFKGGKTSKY